MAGVSARSRATAANDARLGASAAETSGVPVSPQALHRHDLVVLSLLLAIAGIVLALAMTLGTQPIG
jgi:hypothetical protein